MALLHSILGTATKTFAVDAGKIPKLKALLTEFEAIHVETFPSILLLYNNDKNRPRPGLPTRLGRELKPLNVPIADDRPTSPLRFVADTEQQRACVACVTIEMLETEPVQFAVEVEVATAVSASSSLMPR
ncbi:MAG: hypothetical protein ACI9CV_001703 [Ilumatobacter sp.]